MEMGCRITNILVHMFFFPVIWKVWISSWHAKLLKKSRSTSKRILTQHKNSQTTKIWKTCACNKDELKWMQWEDVKRNILKDNAIGGYCLGTLIVDSRCLRTWGNIFWQCLIAECPTAQQGGKAGHSRKLEGISQSHSFCTSLAENFQPQIASRI